jgi:DNA-binding NarL/FixJ family response regulator
MYKILIIDDHPLVIDGVRTMLHDVQTITIIGACKTASEALAFLEQEIPDIVLLDISLPDMDGLQLCGEIRNLCKDCKILGLTSTNEAGIIIHFMQKGGNGYLLKNMEREELLEAIDTVLDGKIYLSKAANQKVLENFHSLQNGVSNVPVITRREKEIMQLLSDGMTGPQIAEKLYLSHHTVETHRKNLFKKFNANNLQMLLKIGREYKLLS